MQSTLLRNTFFNHDKNESRFLYLSFFVISFTLQRMIIINGKFLSQELTGVQRFALEITKELALIRKDILIAAPSENKIIQPVNDLPIKHIGNYGGVMWEQFDLQRWLKKQGSPLLINFCNSGPLYYQPAISTIHDLATIFNPDWFSKFFAFAYQRMLPILAKRSEIIVTVSEQVKKELMAELNLNPNKVKVVYNGLPQVFLNDIHEGKTFVKKRQILAVGSFDPRKNLNLLMDAFAEFPSTEDWKLVIAGRESDLFNYKYQQLPENVKDRIIIKTAVSDNDLVQLYRESEVFVSLSAYEGFGIPVLEAIAHQCRVLVSDIAVFKELFTGYVTFTSLKKEDVKHALTEIMISKETIASATALLEKFSYRKAAIALDEIINSLTSVH